MIHVDIPSAKQERRNEGRGPNPLGVFIAVIKQRPKIAEASHKATFKQMLLSDGYEYELARVIDEWMSIKYNTASRAALGSTPQGIKHLAEQRQEERQRTATALAKSIKEMVLLDLVLPNGKRLHDCTKKDCTDQARKVGPWLTRIAAELKRGQRVGDRFSEEQIRKLYGR